MADQRPGVLVFGSLNVDHVLRVQRLPRSGETVLSRDYQCYPGGKGRNQAVAVAAAGGRVSIAGTVGDDGAGKLLLADVDRAGVERSMVQIVPETPTGVALITVDDDGENTIVVHPGANSCAKPVEAEALDQGAYRVVLCCLEVPLASVEATLGAARSEGLITVVNASPLDAAADETLEVVLLRADVVVVNRSEAVALAGRLSRRRFAQTNTAKKWSGGSNPTEEPEIPVERLAQDIGSWLVGDGPASRRLPKLIVTLGAEGVVYVDAEGVHSVPAYEVKVESTVGAGDAFAGVLCHALACEHQIEAAVKLAVAAGAAQVSVGLSPTSLAEIVRRPVS
jgi:ribokinase